MCTSTFQFMSCDNKMHTNYQMLMYDTLQHINIMTLDFCDHSTHKCTYAHEWWTTCRKLIIITLSMYAFLFCFQFFPLFDLHSIFRFELLVHACIYKYLWIFIVYSVDFVNFLHSLSYFNVLIHNFYARKDLRCSFLHVTIFFSADYDHHDYLLGKM